ncbi:recombinase A [Citrobacter koseri]|uniref:Protein RecA n=1 Tax=Citrobacter koseri TaxID=545 RepID=A0A447UJM8_CITKO|nr:recombinase A [Citrobacter koseri]
MRFIDAEHALDPIYARKLGVDIDNLLCSQPDTGEQALEICDALARSGAVDVIVVGLRGGVDAESGNRR